ncbi:DUF928 domain-containing protein [Cyanobacteria bacterium FACHB-DQ100]|nr:DUF928 domain-containing protein [Cyanobacteria bacterium FACHB-DQ100]
MRHNFFQKQALSCSTIALLISGLFTAFPVNSAPAARFVPPPLPRRGAPSGHPQGGASRGKCPVASSQLTALVPVLPKTPDRLDVTPVWALTVSDRPTFWFYVPYPLTSNLATEFVLQDEQGKYLYQTALTQSGTTPGIVSVTLPNTVSPLEVGKLYHWYFLIYCTPSNPMFVDGWIERRPDASRQSVLSREQVQRYAANGIWYDAVTTLAQLRRQKPKDSTLAQDWTDLLQSAGLGAIAGAPIVDCCTAKQ